MTRTRSRRNGWLVPGLNALKRTICPNPQQLNFVMQIKIFRVLRCLSLHSNFSLYRPYVYDEYIDIFNH